MKGAARLYIRDTFSLGARLTSGVKAVLGIMVALGLLSVLPAAGQAQSFTFTKIADTDTPIPGGTGTFTDFGSGGIAPAIDGADVAFTGRGVSGQQGIYIDIGGVLTVVADQNTAVPGGTGTFNSLGFTIPSLGGGNVAFRGFEFVAPSSFPSGIYSHVGGTLGVVADESTPIPGGTGTFGTGSSTSSFNNVVSIDGVDVAFQGNGTSFQRGVYTNVGGTLSVVANQSSSIPGGTGTFASFNSPSINGGNVAFTASGFGVGKQGIYTDVGGPLSVLADQNTAVPGGTGFFNITNAFGTRVSFDGSNVAFFGRGSAGEQGIYTASAPGGSLAVVADLNTPVPAGTGNFIGFGAPSIDGGNVAFNAAGSAGQLGVYTNVGGTLDKVIDLNDTLDGKGLSAVGISLDGLSGNSVAFRAFFTDGSQGIFVATRGPGTVAFDMFDIERAKVKLRGATRDRFDVKGSFQLGATSDGIDVLNEDVIVTFNGFAETIPAGSFFREDDGEEDDDDGGFQFKGASGGITQIKIQDDGGFKVKAKGLDLSGIDLSNPVPFSLQIGDDLGETEILFDDKGKFKK